MVGGVVAWHTWRGIPRRKDGPYAPAMSEEMTYGHLGRSGLMVSRIGLGTMNFGYTVDESSSFAVMDAAIDAGVSFFDTADVYGGPQTPDMKKGYGIAERPSADGCSAAGSATTSFWPQRCTSRWGSARTTAGCRPTTSGGPARRACGGCRPITSTCTRCTTSTVPRRGRRSGRRWSSWSGRARVSYVGSSNFAAWDVALAQSAASARHFLGLTSEQSLYNLAIRATEMELIPALRHLGIGLVPYSPLHAGLLAGVLENVAEGGISDESTLQRIEAHRDQLEAYEGLCRELGAKPADVALAWLLRNPVVSSAIVGALTIEELHADLGALSVQLDAEVVERLDQIWPGPGEAPQAYAW